MASAFARFGWLQKLLISSRRITTSGTWVPEIDGIRFVAIFLVLVQHIHERLLRRTASTFPEVEGGLLDLVLSQGDMGVMIFFALSGYILGQGLLPAMDRGDKASVGRFYLRRLTRLEPPYILVMVGIFVFLTVTGFRSSHAKSFHEGAASLWDALLASLVYGYGFIYAAYPKLNPPAWSLEIEVQFYLLMPVLAWLITRLRTPHRWVGVVVALLVWAWWLTPWGWSQPRLKASLVTMMPFFLAGLAVVDLNAWLGQRMRRWESSGGLMTGLSLGAFVFLVYGEIWAKSWHVTPANALASGVFLFSALHSRFLRGLLAMPIIAVPGGMCYSIYLIHLPLLEVLASITARFGRSLPYGAFFAVQFCVLTSMVLLVAWVFFRLVERPCMDRAWPVKLSQWLSSKFTARELQR